jgi:nucleotidyltransferase substrate binding protein (TIGR01987 family)
MKQLENFKNALTTLEEFLSQESRSDKEKAGVIQAFEFTFEQAWKFLQKKAMAAGLEANSPRAALSQGVQLGAIRIEDEAAWIEMLKDRNMSSHLYQKSVAKEVFERVSASHSKHLRRLADWAKTA